MRALLEDSPEEGARVVEDASFVAGPLWAEWGEILEGLGMDRARFLEISRGYSDELTAVDTNGHVAVPTGPGLGVTFDWDWI